MLLRKDNFNSADQKYMKLAINLAKNKKGLTGTNPPVGCVIVKNKKVLSYGSTNYNGRPHAETIALNKNKKENTKSTVYITLEPCSHFGKTPPCTNALIKAKVKKVIYSIEDIDPRSFGKSKNILRINKIFSKSGLLKNQVKQLYKSYNYVKKNKIPYVTGKLACSSNFYILKNNIHITNDHSRGVSHLLRYENQGILTSYKTINSDNSKLTCRLNGLYKHSPVRLIIDRDLKINLNSFVVKNSLKPKTIIFHNSKNKFKISVLRNKGVKLIKINVENDNYFDLKKILKRIYKLDIHTLLVESGKNLTSSFLLQNLFNDFYLFKSNKNLYKKHKIKVFNIKKYLNKKFKNKNFVNTYLDKDELIYYY